MTDNYAKIRARQDREARDAAYAQGRADERAAIVRWLREPGPSIWCNVHMRLADEIERGEHER